MLLTILRLNKFTQTQILFLLMKCNVSLPKMYSQQLNNRLHRLKQQNKSRLQFPQNHESRKHYFEMNYDHVKLGPQNGNPYNKVSKRNNLDVSDIEGAKPRIIQKQKNVQKYYQNQEQYGAKVMLPGSSQSSNILKRTSSQPKIKNYRFDTIPDSLDSLQKQLMKKSNVKSQSKRQVTEPRKQDMRQQVLQSQTRLINRGLQIQSRNYENYMFNPQKVLQRQQQPKKALFYNPSFMSSLSLM